jgi:methenyltetrahydrofolate cyclohydrolase
LSARAKRRRVDVPLAIAETAAEVAGLAAEAVAAGKPALRGDAETAALLAAAAAARRAGLRPEQMTAPGHGR